MLRKLYYFDNYNYLGFVNDAGYISKLYNKNDFGRKALIHINLLQSKKQSINK